MTLGTRPESKPFYKCLHKGRNSKETNSCPSKSQVDQRPTTFPPRSSGDSACDRSIADKLGVQSRENRLSSFLLYQATSQKDAPRMVLVAALARDPVAQADERSAAAEHGGLQSGQF